MNMTLTPELALIARLPTNRLKFEALKRLPMTRPQLSYPSLPSFAALTHIETPQETVTRRPFVFWPDQVGVAAALFAHTRIVILKARQLGITWVLCTYALMLMLTKKDQTVLVFSQGQLEANNIIERIRFLYDNHTDRAKFPPITEDNKSTLAFANGSTVKSLPATRKAGRSFTASLVILDEFAFMTWGASLLKAVKPTIDNGGQMVILSSADGSGSTFHEFCLAAQAGTNGYHFIFLPWTAHPGRGREWRDERIRESLIAEDVYREYPETAEEAFTYASGLVYSNFTGDNITQDEPDFSLTFELAIDDGYIDPRAILFIQKTPRAILVFDEIYKTHQLDEVAVTDILRRCCEWYCKVNGKEYDLIWPHALTSNRARAEHLRKQGVKLPDLAAVSHEAVELRANLKIGDMVARNWMSGATVKGSARAAAIKITRGLICDGKGERVIKIHPRCENLLREIRTQYRYPEGNTSEEMPVDGNDHAIQALEGWCFLRARR